jgi:type IV secretory pathway TrbF-like protein
MLPPTNDFNAARRLYMELYGSALVRNNYLTIAVLCLCALHVGDLVLHFRQQQIVREFKPLVVRIDSLARPEAVAYDTLEYKPRDAEIRHFLTQFVQQHYSRMRATLRENYPRSLYFLDGRLADATIEANKKTKAIETFLAGQGEEIEVKVRNVAIEDLRSPPYRATVDFEKIYYSPADHAEIRREKYAANFVFIVKDRVPNALIPVNPLGLTITYFREDQAFEEKK